MSRPNKQIGMVLVILVAGGVGLLLGWLARNPPGNEVVHGPPIPRHGPPPPSGVVALVRTARLQRGRISDRLTAYGSVVARPSAIRNIAVPFACQVLEVLVSSGQRVTAQQPLLIIRANSDVLSQFQQTVSNVAATAKQLAEVEQRYRLRLTTRGALLTARQNALVASLALRGLEKQGISTKSTILHAGENGIVASIPSQPGAMVPAGGPLLELVTARNIEIRFGVEPEDSIRLHVGQPVRMYAVGMSNRNPPMGGRIALITERVDPRTRLVNMFVTPDSSDHLILGQYIRGSITLRVFTGLLAPRAAVLPYRNGYRLFTVFHGHAIAHRVQVHIGNGREVGVTGAGLAAGQKIVSVGNAELTNGMAVQENPRP